MKRTLRLLGLAAFIGLGLALPATARAVSPGNVAGWGDNTSSQASGGNSLTQITAIAAGASHNLALRSNGTVAAWGLNNHNQASVPAGLTGVVAVSAGADHSLALKSNHRVVAWGSNVSGQATVPASLTTASGIAAGGGFSLALRTNGTVVGWGANTHNQTGGAAGVTAVKAIAAGANHALALKTNGTVVAWGLNESGDTVIPAGLSKVTAIAAGNGFSMALRGGGVVAWGRDDLHQIDVPTAAKSGVVAIAAGGSFGLALKSTGMVVAWGGDSKGAVSGVSGLANVTSIAAGAGHGICIWGASQLALAGLPSPYLSSESRSVTVTVKGPSGGTTTIYTGRIHFTSSDKKAILPADYTFTAADKGVHSFTVTLKTAGKQSLTATDTKFGTVAGSQTVTVAARVPGAPGSVLAVAGNGLVDVSWKAPSTDGGAALTGYKVKALPGGATCTTTKALTCTIAGLKNGTSYTFTVTATNSAGTGAASEPSVPVMPTAPATPTPTATAIPTATPPATPSPTLEPSPSATPTASPGPGGGAGSTGGADPGMLAGLLVLGVLLIGVGAFGALFVEHTLVMPRRATLAAEHGPGAGPEGHDPWQH
jgi:hypothetical protein